MLNWGGSLTPDKSIYRVNLQLDNDSFPPIKDHVWLDNRWSLVMPHWWWEWDFTKKKVTSYFFFFRYTKYLYPYECEMKRLSTPNELQAAIDGNKREGRRTGYDTYSMFPGPRPQVPLPPSSLPLPQISPLPPGLRPSFNGQGSPFLSEYLLSTYIGYFINLTEKFVKRGLPGIVTSI